MASCSTPSFEVVFNDIANKKAVRFSSQCAFSFYPDRRLISRCSRLVRGSNHSLRTKSMFPTPYSAAFSKIIIEYAFLGYSDFSYLISQKFAVFPFSSHVHKLCFRQFAGQELGTQFLSAISGPSKTPMFLSTHLPQQRLHFSQRTVSPPRCFSYARSNIFLISTFRDVGFSQK